MTSANIYTDVYTKRCQAVYIFNNPQTDSQINLLTG